MFQRSVATTISLLLICALCRASFAERFALQDDDVVVFVGGSNLLKLQRAGHLEAMLTSRFAAQRPRFRDFSWEADTVFRQGTVIERWRPDGFGDRDEQFKRVAATIVVAQFGQLESFAGPAGLKDFTAAYEQLVDDYLKQSRIVVLVTPIRFEKPDSPQLPDLSARNDDLALYVEATRKIAAAKKQPLVDLFKPSAVALTDNGMHLRESALARVAREIARQLDIETAGGEQQLEQLRAAVIEKHRLWYDYWRPANWKLLYGDDSQRQFTRGGKDYIPFREEWKKLAPLIETAEQRVWTIAAGGEDPGHNRPAPERLHADPNANIADELAAFEVVDGLSVNLFASERDGLTSPLAVRWDPAGRMYVTVTTTYPHVFPGDVPNDKIVVLEDVDRDGRADKSTVFAEGLNIPTGLEVGDGGVYVGQNSEILFLRDTDGDLRADERRVLLGGFGNGDSHQTINSFVWSPDGELFFGQGDGIESRVETPWGVSSLYRSGFYRLRPKRLQLLPFLDDHMGPGNPWGVAFDDWGQIFSVDGAGGVSWLPPALVPTTHRVKYRTIGEPGGYCGITYLDGSHLPDQLRGDFAIGDFKANRIKRFAVSRDGAGFELQWKEPLLRSRHRNFRPVDVKVGPDGAIYVVDWYNPITCHQDDAYRDPTRDKAHGRIWRIAANRPSVRPPNLSAASLDVVLDALASPAAWTRYQAKRALTERDVADVSPALDKWVRELDVKQPTYEHQLFSALGAYATLEVVEPVLLNRVLNAADPRARAFATRLVGRWHDRLEQPLEMLARRIEDEDSLVRLEAVVACSLIPDTRAMRVAARITDRPMDDWHRYALTQTIHHLKPHVLGSLRAGRLPAWPPHHLAAVLQEVGGRDELATLKRLVESPDLDRRARASMIAAILAVGEPAELRKYGLDPNYFVEAGEYRAAEHAAALARLAEVTRLRNVRPSGNLVQPLARLLENESPELKARTLALIGTWRVDQQTADVAEMAHDRKLSTGVRAAAFAALVKLEAPGAKRLLDQFSVPPHAVELRSAAIRSLASVDAETAARRIVELFDDPQVGDDDLPDDIAATVAVLLGRWNTGAVLAETIRSRPMQPSSAKRMLRSLYSSGRTDALLINALNQKIGVSVDALKYSEDFVNSLVSDAASDGDANRGSVLFQRMACNSCHQVSGLGGAVGPNLTAIGTTLAPARIVEELLWPNRQVKEGYTVVAVVTDQGKVYRGYEKKTRESRLSGHLVIQDLTTHKLVTIPRDAIEEQRAVGSSMPEGITALLSRSQLVDLVAYLSQLGKLQE
ncbi:MAG: c-type cytochrome [Pirellulaceae bacterium]|nr:c-type cytochrome [Pirellulaceae bacterium]